jgi:hypothetical protein
VPSKSSLLVTNSLLTSEVAYLRGRVDELTRLLSRVVEKGLPDTSPPSTTSPSTPPHPFPGIEDFPPPPADWSDDIPGYDHTDYTVAQSTSHLPFREDDYEEPS